MVPAAGVVALPAAATSSVPTQTAAATATSQWAGSLKKSEHKDTFRTPVGEVTVEFDQACPALKVTVRAPGGVRDAAQGTSPQSVSADLTGARAKVTITKTKATQHCSTTWSATTTIDPAAQSLRRRPAPTPKPTPTTPTPTPTPTTASPTPAPTTASPTPTPTTATPTPTPTSSAPAVVGITPEQFGAKGDGVSDDTAAVQSALNSVRAGGTVTLPAGKTYRHTAVLRMSVAGTTLNGSGTLLATNEAASAVYLAADNITVDGPTLKMGVTTKRWVAFEQMKLRLGRFAGIVVRNVMIDGSAAAGVYVGGASNFLLAGVTVANTRADAIHMTGGASNGTVNNPRVVNPGDDGVAVVSYKNDGAQVHDITVNNPRLEGQVWGRAFSVVGGYNVTYNNVYASRSAGACIYIAAESEFNSYGVNNVLVNGGNLVGCNQQADVDAVDRPSPAKGRVVHGAVMVYNSQPAEAITNVTMRNLTIKDTHLDGYDQVKLNNTSTGSISRQDFNTVAITGGSKYLFKATGVAAGGLPARTPGPRRASPRPTASAGDQGRRGYAVGSRCVDSTIISPTLVPFTGVRRDIASSGKSARAEELPHHVIGPDPGPGLPVVQQRRIGAFPEGPLVIAADQRVEVDHTTFATRRPVAQDRIAADAADGGSGPASVVAGPPSNGPARRRRHPAVVQNIGSAVRHDGVLRPVQVDPWGGGTAVAPPPVVDQSHATKGGEPTRLSGARHVRRHEGTPGEAGEVDAATVRARQGVSDRIELGDAGSVQRPVAAGR